MLIFDSCLENPHRQRSLAGCSPWDLKESDTTEQLSTRILDSRNEPSDYQYARQYSGTWRLNSPPFLLYFPVPSSTAQRRKNK